MSTPKYKKIYIYLTAFAPYKEVKKNVSKELIKHLIVHYKDINIPCLYIKIGKVFKVSKKHISKNLPSFHKRIITTNKKHVHIVLHLGYNNIGKEFLYSQHVYAPNCFMVESPLNKEVNWPLEKVKKLIKNEGYEEKVYMGDISNKLAYKTIKRFEKEENVKVGMLFVPGNCTISFEGLVIFFHKLFQILYDEYIGT